MCKYGLLYLVASANAVLREQLRFVDCINKRKKKKHRRAQQQKPSDKNWRHSCAIQDLSTLELMQVIVLSTATPLRYAICLCSTYSPTEKNATFSLTGRVSRVDWQRAFVLMSLRMCSWSRSIASLTLSIHRHTEFFICINLLHNWCIISWLFYVCHITRWDTNPKKN